MALEERVGGLVGVGGRPQLSAKPRAGGRAVFGPYPTREARKHRVEFSMPMARLDEERNPPIAVVDATAGVVVVLFNALTIRPRLEDDERYLADQLLSGVESRLYIHGAEPLLTGQAPKDVAVERLEPWPQTNPPPGLLDMHSDRVRSLVVGRAAVGSRGPAFVVTGAGRPILLTTGRPDTGLSCLGTTSSHDGQAGGAATRRLHAFQATLS